jgi:hypothetical protein
MFTLTENNKLLAARKTFKEIEEMKRIFGKGNIDYQQNALQKFIKSCSTEDREIYHVKNCAVSILDRTYRGVYYVEESYSPRFERNLPTIQFYLLGNAPKNLEKYYYEFDNKEFYSGGAWFYPENIYKPTGYLIKDGNITRAQTYKDCLEYHPFGNHFRISEWSIPNCKIDDYKDKKKIRKKLEVFELETFMII